MTGRPAPPRDETVRIALWSGPRNLSTALMRSFGNRDDCAVYLTLTGLDHPMREEILRHHEKDWRKVADALAGPCPGGRTIFYQKHMTHHMLPEIGREWMGGCRHAFLIRDADTLLADPPKILRRLCDALRIAFREEMLSWPAGPKATDGVWAPHWYGAVNRSTGFEPATPRPKLEDVALLRLEERALPLYDKLARYALS
jgi:hypothetical protein